MSASVALSFENVYETLANPGAAVARLQDAWFAREPVVVELGVDAARLCVGGDSAGGNLAAVVAIAARDGTNPIPAVPSAIRKIVTSSAALRPLASPSRPIRMPPSGRTTKPRPKVAKTANNPASGSLDGKNFNAIRGAI